MFGFLPTDGKCICGTVWNILEIHAEDHGFETASKILKKISYFTALWPIINYTAC